MCVLAWNKYSCCGYRRVVGTLRKCGQNPCPGSVYAPAPVRNMDETCGRPSCNRRIAPNLGAFPPVAQQVLAEEEQARQYRLRQERDAAAARQQIAARQAAHGQQAPSGASSSYCYGPGFVGGGEASPIRYASAPLSPFGTPAPASPQQAGVVYDANGRPLRAGTVRQTGPMSVEEDMQRFIADWRRNDSTASPEGLAILYKETFQDKGQLWWWSQSTQK